MTERERFEEYWNNYGELHASMCGGDIKLFAMEMWQASRRWIPVSEDMPKNGVPVLAYGYNEYGKLRRIRAAYVRKHTIEDPGEDYTGDLDYNEDTDTNYWPKGWYEWNEIEETHWMVEFPIIGWQPMPEVEV